MRNALLSGLLTLAAVPASAAPTPFPAFRVQEIDKSLKVGYAVRIADVNADGRKDVVVCDADRVIWFDNAGGWKLNTITQGKVKADNVCIDLYDIDGDRKLDLVLGADWQFNNTKSGGTLQWLRQGDDVTRQWEVHSILKELPTLHRVHFGDLTGDGRPELIAGPLKGRDSTQPANFMDQPVQLLAFPIPKDPAKGPWESQVLADTLHVMHNFQPVDFDGTGKVGVLTASYEGVSYVSRSGDGKWTTRLVGAGHQEDPKASRGASEIKLGRLKGGRRFIATAEPFHGNYVVAYTEGGGAPGLWKRTVVDEQIKWGHAVACADLDGDGADEFVLGYRDPLPGSRGPGVNVYRAAATGTPGTAADVVSWEKHVIEDKGVATEDMTCGDLNGDGRVDIVAVGRATKNVRIYWNEGMPGAKASPPTQSAPGTTPPGPPGPPGRRG